ncbi:Protein arginine N-methyltransferase SFM1 {ECO:0000305/PubMed:22650761} {ECO:0000269/PubMed:22650761}; AltName: Full=SPOUT family methyltransferase 1 {ECO:0000303/PubMed:22650761} [Serendipita indica DSM 11827]|nr:Protein arginine N-methyltransferase SFM1 {ECO:0000305/PubMed:22650761} {ECO:0000269/PubMed:22650761}; AltName: Full=SPOUT family methyltransferase 1 {ECO:0000303/PubMed:22650761} [Serendipita indica DSM 11827]
MPCDTVILVATLIHAVNSRHLHALGGGSAALPVLTRVYHDGMAHYAVTLALRLWGAFSVIIPPTPYRLAPEVFVLAFTSIVASRFFLGLRKSISQMSRQALGLSETGIDTFLLSRVPPSRSLAWTTTTSTADVAPTPRSQPRVGSPWDAKVVRSHIRGDEHSILEYMKLQGVPMNRVCLLDPRGSKELSPEDGSEFEWFLFGGILGMSGDDPPRDRTGELRALGFAGRRLGPIQMTTDTALGVTKMIVQDQMTMETIPFVDHPTIKFSKTESVEMPFRYIIKEGEPLLPGGMKQHLYDDLNRGFND